MNRVKDYWTDLSAGAGRLWGAVREQFKKLSGREKALVAAGVLIIFVFAAYSIYEPIRTAFAEQQSRIENAQRDIDNVYFALDRYLKLRSRRQAIEDLYKEVEISEGVRSLLSSIVENKAGIPAGQYDITDRDTREFGVGYEQKPYQIKFVITSYERLVAFLNEIVHGPKPLILTSLNIRKRPTADGSLEVELDVSSIRKISK